MLADTPSVLVITRDVTAAWRCVLSRLESRIDLIETADAPPSAHDYDILLLDWDHVAARGTVSQELLSGAIIVATSFNAPVRDALLRSGASACIEKSNPSELAAVLDREIARANRGFLRNEETARRLQALTEAVFDGMLVHDVERVLEINRAGAAMFGYTPDEMIGMPLRRLVDPELFDSLLASARTGGMRLETRGVHRDGSTFAFEISGTNLDESGQRIAVFRDITERKEYEDALIESEQRYRELSESSNDLVCEHAVDGRILRVNPAAARALEMSADELCTMNIRDILHHSARADFDVYLQTIAEEGAAEGLMVVQTRRGEKRVWHYRNTLHSVGVAEPFVRGLGHDVTEREEALENLRRSERHFRSIIETASDMILIVQPSGRITYHSPATERLLGYSADEIDERIVLDLAHPDDRDRVLELFKDGANDSSIDVRLRHADGSWRWLSVVAGRVRKGNGPFVVNGRDITERRLLESQLEQAKRLTSLGRLTATVAHEFNNVLMGMQPFADLMQRPGVSPDVVVKGARHISNSIARGKRVALDMLRFTRPAQPATAPMQLREWWDRLRPELQATTTNDIEFTWSFPASLTVLADPVQVSQVFSNLVSNARDAMPRGGKLSVRARRPFRGESFSFGLVPEPEKFAHILVTDSGSGMPEEVLRHAFDPLFTTKQNGGTGLGLAVAHQVVSKHGGSIFAESEVGVGTTFHVFLPLATEACAPDQSCDDTEVEIRAQRVLIVDDEPLIGEGIAEVLRDRGFEVVVVSTGNAAVDAAKEMNAEIAIVDIWLPDIDGLEVGARLRALDPKLKIVFASGHGNATHALESCAPAAFLQKPFEIRELLDVIASMESEER